MASQYEINSKTWFSERCPQLFILFFSHSYIKHTRIKIHMLSYIDQKLLCHIMLLMSFLDEKTYLHVLSALFWSSVTFLEVYTKFCDYIWDSDVKL